MLARCIYVCPLPKCLYNDNKIIFNESTEKFLSKAWKLESAKLTANSQTLRSC